MLSKLSTLDNINNSNYAYPDAYPERGLDCYNNDVGLFNEHSLNTQLIIIPYWIADTIRRNKLDHIDILEYGVVQKILSIEDMAHFLFINESVISGLNSRFFIYDAWVNTIADNNDNILNQLMRLLDAIDIKQDIHARLSDEKLNISKINDITDINTSNDTLYLVELKKDGHIYITIKRGFLNALNIKEFTRQFYTDILKKLYSVQAIHDVSSYEIFKLYLKNL
jgi:hypothetical protein